ncbi:MAG: NAD-dependent epimerase/dehydratase family protein [Actinomycetota bacterium]|nr:NAD-dependent epimerase/dehydratase family protein [Actinomycetota bacterium]
MRIAVTGATGYIGAHSAKALLAAGHQLRLLIHPAEHPEKSLGALDIRPTDYAAVVGDVRDSAVVAALLTGCDAVLHAAGIVGVDDRREALMWQVNTQATATLLTRAVGLGLDPIVHVASYSALFPCPDPVIGPDSPTADGRSAYGRTKSAADRIARALQAGGAPVVITYPSSVIGPAAGTQRGITATGWAGMLRYGVAPVFDGGMAMIDVRDVADVHAAVMRPGQGPRRYVCGGVMVPFATLVDLLEEGNGRRIRRLPVSKGAMKALGRACDLAAKVLPVSPGISYEAVWLLTTATPTDDSRTLTELGLSWRPVRQALLDTFPTPSERTMR